MSDPCQMFYMLVNVHHQIAIGEVLPPPDRFWYYLPDLPFGIQNAAASFQLELEHLVSHEAPRSVILSSAVGTDVPSLRTFLEILIGIYNNYIILFILSLLTSLKIIKLYTTML